MSDSNSIFNSWIPNKVLVILLALAMFPHLMLLSLFNMNSTFTASFLDVEIEDLQFMFSMAYANIVCGMFFHKRLFEAFNIRNYLLLMTILNIILLFAMTLTTNKEIILILRYVQGPLALFEGCILLPVLMSSIKHKHTKLIAYSILYAYMLTADKINTSLVKFAIQQYDHNAIMYVVIAMHLLSLFVFLLVLNKGRLFDKKPLYQLNIGGGFLFSLALSAGAYCLIYGKKYEWFESMRIIVSLSIFLIASGLFLLHQRTSKRRLFHFEVFQSERIILGVLLFISFYIMRAGMSNIYQIMQSVWHWHWEYVLQIQYFNVAGSLLGVVLSYVYFSKTERYKIIFLIGFAGLTCSFIWFRQLFVLDIEVSYIAPALFLQGFSQGFLFTPLVFYMISSVAPNISPSASQTGTAVRFWTSTIGFAIMQNALLYFNTKNQYSLSQNLKPENPIFYTYWQGLMQQFGTTHLPYEALQLSTMTVQKQVAKEALLLSNMEIFAYLIGLGIVVFIAILLYRPVKNLYFTHHPNT